MSFITDRGGNLAFLPLVITCFDSEDSMYENRYFTNLVFAESHEEVARKLEVLMGMSQFGNKAVVELHSKHTDCITMLN